MQDFEVQTRAFAARIETELDTGHLNFPTSMDISLRIKQLADDPDSSIEDIVTVVRTEPVLSAKVIRMANAMLLNPYGAHITSVNNAVRRIGLSALRCLAFAVAAEQLIQDHRSPHLRKIAAQLWRHSADISSWAYAFAHCLRTANPDTAMLTGMMVDIGQFFLLARVADYPALEGDFERFTEFVSVWNTPVTRSVLEAFELPDDIVDALDSDSPYSGDWPPKELHDLVRIATMATKESNPFNCSRKNDSSPEAESGIPGIDKAQFNSLLEETRAGKDAMLYAVHG
ncbi:MAG: HDOD domain-containing protein [Azoarcus sp.]|jgi:HD-like signal output (HDOD) protein|nr:HDOD domain-containing protein [Azoarcus sp.]